MDDNGLICRRRGWLTSWIDDDLLMMNAASRYFLNLSGCGGRIWELLETPRTLDHLCRDLARVYVIEPAAARAEVAAFLERMSELDAIEVHPAEVA